ncbi:MAG: hypothetical protein MUO26_08020 [Methanotrichaceae archaeon]|nr:hypothetical protein [Methanotrichaceae archaeon]
MKPSVIQFCCVPVVSKVIAIDGSATLPIERLIIDKMAPRISTAKIWLPCLGSSGST